MGGLANRPGVGSQLAGFHFMVPAGVALRCHGTRARPCTEALCRSPAAVAAGKARHLASRPLLASTGTCGQVLFPAPRCIFQLHPSCHDGAVLRCAWKPARMYMYRRRWALGFHPRALARALGAGTARCSFHASGPLSRCGTNALAVACCTHTCAEAAAGEDMAPHTRPRVLVQGASTVHVPS